ncbi:MAG: glycosyltransferase family protein [Pirellulales bacterium]
MATSSEMELSQRTYTTCRPFIIAGFDLPLSERRLKGKSEDSHNAIEWWQRAVVESVGSEIFKGMLLAPAGLSPNVDSSGEKMRHNWSLESDNTHSALGLELVEFSCPLLNVRFDGVDGQLAYPYLHHRLEIDRLIRAQQSTAYRNGGMPISLHAVTPGLIGATLRRIASERNLPFVANYFPNLLGELEQRALATLNEWRSNRQLSLRAILGASGLGDDVFPWLIQEDDLWNDIQSIWRNVQLAQNKLLTTHNWWSLSWGKALLWIVRHLSSYAADRVTGTVAMRDIARDLERLADKLEVRLPGRGGVVRSEGVEEVFRRLARLVAQSYLRWFYRDCDLVMAWGDSSTCSELRDALGIDGGRIRWVENGQSPWTVDQMVRTHDEAVRANAQAVRQPRVIPLQSHAWEEVAADMPQFSSFAAISDIHLGDGDPVERALGLAKLYDCLRHLGIESVFYVGDIGELSATRKRYENHQLIFNRVRQDRQVSTNMKLDLLMSKIEIPDLDPASRRYGSIVEQLRKDALRRGLIPYLNGEPIDILPGISAVSGDKSCILGGTDLRETAIVGNHDEGLDLGEVLPGCLVAPSLVHYSLEHGAVFHHGHALGLMAFRQSLEQSENVQQICDTLTTESLGSELETAAVVHDAATASWRLSEGMIDLRRLWKETLQPTMSRAVQSFRELRQSGASDNDGLNVRFLESLLSPADDLHLAAQLAAAADHPDSPCWIEVGGHSHVPGIDKVRVAHPRYKTECTKLVVNCGKFHGDPMTCVVAKFPEVVIAQWSKREQEWRISMRASLTAVEWRDAQRMVAAANLTGGSTGSVRRTTASKRSFATDCRQLDGKVLCECPTEGDGHITRLQCLYPFYQAQGVTRTILSGPRAESTQALTGIDVDLRATGYALLYDDRGNVRRWSSMADMRRRSRAVESEARQLAKVLGRFDYLISDFGPTITRAYQLAAQHGSKPGSPLPRLFQVSHQAALLSRYREHLPQVRADRISPIDRRLGQWAIDRLGAGEIIGFHYERYHEDCFNPLIRPDLLGEKARFDGDFILVVLRADLQTLRELIAPARIKADWKIYTDRVQSPTKLSPGIFAMPRCRTSFQNDLLHCQGVLADCGFGITSEVLHLGIPFVGRPVGRHFEQLSNAAALEKISQVGVVYDLQRYDTRRLLESVLGLSPSASRPLSRTGMMGPIGRYNGVAEQVAHRMFGGAGDPGKSLL